MCQLITEVNTAMWKSVGPLYFYVCSGMKVEVALLLLTGVLISICIQMRNVPRHISHLNARKYHSTTIETRRYCATIVVFRVQGAFLDRLHRCDVQSGPGCSFRVRVGGLAVPGWCRTEDRRGVFGHRLLIRGQRLL